MMLFLLISISSCKTIDTKEIQITPFTELVSIPKRPYLAPIGEQAIKDLSSRLATVINYSEKLEMYSINMEEYYLKFIDIEK